MSDAPRHGPGAIDDADREGVLNPPAGAQSPARLRQGCGGSAEAGKAESERRRKGEPEPSALGSSRARSEGALSGMAWGPAAVKGVTV